VDTWLTQTQHCDTVQLKKGTGNVLIFSLNGRSELGLAEELLLHY